MGASQSTLNSLTAEQIADFVGSLGDGEKYADYVDDIKDNGVDGKLLAGVESDEKFKNLLTALKIKSDLHKQKLLSEWQAAKDREQAQQPPIPKPLQGPLDDVDKLMQEEWVPQWGCSRTTLGKRFRETWADPDRGSNKKIASAPPPHDAEAMALTALEPALRNSVEEHATTDSSNQNMGLTEKPPQPEAMAPSMEEPPTDEADDAKEAAAIAHDEQQKAADMALVEVFPPEEGWSWYLGEQGDPFYLRCSVKNLVHVLLKGTTKAEGPMEGSPEESRAKVYVISGAAGIGKSWSINAFMTVLLGAGIKVFFHSGVYKRAWKIHKVGSIEHNVKPENIQALGKEWVYVYDSPGEKDPEQRAEARTGSGKVTLIFSSPKASNYEFSIAKTNGPAKILHLPSWTKAEMSEIYPNQAEAVGASYDIWGGNMRAFDKFVDVYRENPNEAKRVGEHNLDIHIGKIDKDFAEKMVTKLEKQEVQGKFIGEDVHNTPGHILTPEPTITDAEAAKCYEEFQWHFCSPLAEKKFWKHVKGLMCFPKKGR